MEYKIKYPFRKSTTDAIWLIDHDADWSTYKMPTVVQWYAGARPRTNGYTEWMEANGEGYMIITEISRHELPKPYPARVFYTRKWIDPDGKEFGKNKIHITVASNFKKIISGYYGEEYEIEEYDPEIEKIPF